MKLKFLIGMFWLLFLLLGCRDTSPATSQPAEGAGQGAIAVATPTVPSAPTNVATPTPVPVQPTPTALPATPVQIPVTCLDIDTYWGNDWEAVIETLEQLMAANQSCGEEPLLSKKYAAHYIYGVGLEEKGEAEAAVEQYRAALFIDAQRAEALEALFRLNALPKPTPPACLSTLGPLPDPAPAEAADPSLFVTVAEDELQLNGETFQVKGVKYYPRHAPWKRFFEETDPAKMAQELDLIEQAGFNTVRVFLWYLPLFTCQPEDAIPNEAAFALIDSLFQMAEERELKLIVTLNDLPDLMFRPLYTDLDHYDNQTVYIVRRYRNEPALLAWDVRNGGDHDYRDDQAHFTQPEVLQWLNHITQLIREHDPHHLLTAGWTEEPLVTEPYVDFISFQHWGEPAELQARLEEYLQKSEKPLLLEAAGYHSWPEAPDDPQSEETQADKLAEVVKQVEAAEGLDGWVIWTAFDFVPPPGWAYTYEYFFGLWRVDLTAKPALEELPLP